MSFRVLESEILGRIIVLCTHGVDEEVRNMSFEILFLITLVSSCRVRVAMEGALEVFVERIKTPDQSDTFRY